MKNRFLLITLTILTMGFLSTTVRAQYGPPAQPPFDPQAQPQGQPQAPTAVGRLSVVHGQVSTMHADGNQWGAGTVNTPVVPGDRVSTADRSRAEIQLDPANVMRLDQNTEIQVPDLEQNKIDIQLASGLVDLTVNRGTQADLEIDTPNMGVHPLAPGIYRVQVNSPSETLLIVRQGEAEVLTNQGSVKIEPGQIINIHGTDNPEYKIDPAPGGDDFDKWSMDRDRQIQNAQSLQHTDPQQTGSSDLDAYGQWNEVPDYGWCWTPQVDAGWVPYSAGYWGYEPYWGYTWISAEPWGWAPYHYGRWFMYGGAWRWWPARGLGGMWAPGYVSFFGFGSGFGGGFGFGSIGWLALGPRDVFHPWFGAGRGFGALGINDIHGAGFVHPGGPAYGSNLEHMTSDARIRGAVRNVSAQDFASGRMGRSMPVSDGMLRNASMMRGSLPVTHTQSSMGNRTGNFGSNRSASANGEHFFSRGGTASAAHTYEMTGRAGGNTQSFGARSNYATTGRAGTGTPSAGGSAYNWQRYSTTGRAPATGSGSSSGFQGRSAPTTQGSQGWQRYASPNPYTSSRQGYASAPRSYSGSSSYGAGSRPSLNLNRPIMRQRAPSYGPYSGGRSSAPAGGTRTSAPGSGHTYSAPHSSGGGGSHSSGGGHSGGRR